MNQAEWDAHWRSLAAASEKRVDDAAVRVKELVELYAPIHSNRRALDLACGAGVNALWLAEQCWTVTAVDRAPAAIDLVQSEATRRGLNVTTCHADLEAHEFRIEPGAWDLILMSRYLQIDLFEPARLGLAPGGLLIVIALLADPATPEPQQFRIKSAKLASHFRDQASFTIVHQRETVTSPDSFSHRQAFAEIAVQRDREG